MARQLAQIGEIIEVDCDGTKGRVVGYEFSDRPGAWFPYRSYSVDLQEGTYYHPDFNKRFPIPEGVIITEQYELL